MPILSGLILAACSLTVSGADEQQPKALFQAGHLVIWERKSDSPALLEGLKVYSYLMRGGVHRGVNSRKQPFSRP